MLNTSGSGDTDREEGALWPLSGLGGGGLVQVGIEGGGMAPRGSEEGPVREPCDEGRSRRARSAPPRDMLRAETQTRTRLEL